MLGREAEAGGGQSVTLGHSGRGHRARMDPLSVSRLPKSVQSEIDLKLGRAEGFTVGDSSFFRITQSHPNLRPSRAEKAPSSASRRSSARPRATAERAARAWARGPTPSCAARCRPGAAARRQRAARDARVSAPLPVGWLQSRGARRARTARDAADGTLVLPTAPSPRGCNTRARSSGAAATGRPRASSSTPFRRKRGPPSPPGVRPAAAGRPADGGRAPVRTVPSAGAEADPTGSTGGAAGLPPSRVVPLLVSSAL